MLKWLRKLLDQDITALPVPEPERKRSRLKVALSKAREQRTAAVTPRYPLQAPVIPPGVIPAGEKSGIAMDSNFSGFCATPGLYGFQDGGYVGFPGYPKLSSLATRAEYRQMASALATELTREWITINSTETADDKTKEKVTELTKALEDIGLQQTIQRAAEHDAYFGRAQLLICLKGHDDLELPLVLDPRTIKPGSFEKVVTVEAIWTTPASYNALLPQEDDFYKPPFWFMLGQKVHHTRLLTVITRPLPDMLKPAFNFGGMSLSQLAEAYVDNWLRTRTSVSDLISNFSIINLSTKMSDVLYADDDGTDLMDRTELFTVTRSNRGLMVTDKDTEVLEQLAVPLGGLDKLQAQAQEHMCSVSRMPAIILTGIEPTGLNASSEGSIRSWYDWVAALQEAFWRKPIDTIFKILQLSMYGEIDPDISFEFVPLFQMTAKELSEIRTADGTTATAYINAGVLDGEEVREKLARDPESGYQGLDLSKEITPPDQGGDDEGDGNEDDE